MIGTLSVLAKRSAIVDIQLTRFPFTPDAPELVCGDLMICAECNAHQDYMFEECIFISIPIINYESGSDDIR